MIVYKSLTHPGTNGFVEPATLAERLRHVEIARERLGTTIPFVCDSMDNDIKHALNAAPNAEFVIDASGTILRKRFWHDPIALRSFLEELVGPVANPTTVADLGDGWIAPAPKIRHGVVPALTGTRGGRAVRARPLLESGPDAQPAFVKLVAEADRGLMENGTGSLYLGFHLDPLYGVHWNNPAGAFSYRIDAPDVDGFEPVSRSAPQFDHDVDVDPREFLQELSVEPGTRLLVTAAFAICDDADTYCVELEQRFEVILERDPDGGSRAGDWMTELVGDPMQFDANGDGRVVRDELPADRALLILSHHDLDYDDAITADEATRFHEMVRIRRGERGR